ncbi:GGDEF domain-containing protein [Aeromicrobium chenweiae]|uniref:Uncharacterized protein n=1 Tax=Aeromicrobium chenweiae TaxID=2079793 RepID=A0A2S0WNJ2_9ACTN|nr:GGDEF domain-containing protein [Aeromicrobium chenweiae]AWB92872.1 hypothetical protein C3E78_12030 [Aeromicrobium chenweiae]TGN33867.1 GGDEF domain-containing protein [Aeromicrobium chenweiae]
MSQTSVPSVLDSMSVWHRRGSLHFAGSFVVLVLATIVTGSVDRDSVVVLVAVPLLAAVSASVLVLTGWADRQWSLLMWPLIPCLSIGALDFVAPQAADLVMGLVVLSFLFIGVSQPPLWGLWFVAPAAVLYEQVLDLGVGDMVVRVPIAAVVWVVCSEVPARLVEELRRKNASLVELATTDSLTGLLNRSRLEVHLDVAGPAGAVALIDLDHFKRFNDSHGHVAGDVALMDFATVLASETRSHDLVFRYGGEEFLVVMANTSPEEAALVLGRVRESWRGHGSGLTFSAGVTFGGASAVHGADILLYAAKAAGRDRVVVDTARGEPAVV